MKPITLPCPPAFERQPGSPWPVADAVKFLSISLSSLTRAEKAGKLRTIRIGRRVYVPDAEMTRIATEGLPAA